MAFMRQSKFRHVFGKPEKRDGCYDGIRITKSSWESTYCAVNPKFVAIVTEAAGGGAFLVLPLSKVGRVAIDCPQVAGHKGAVMDVQWCPHDDNVIASASEDCTVKVWQIPDSGLVTPLTEPVANLTAHQKRVGIVAWHPTAQNVLVSSGSDNKMYFWNVGTEEAMLEIDIPEQVWSLSFNYNGSRLVCTAKDKMMRVIDTHSGDILQESKAHDGAKPVQCCYLKDGKILTTGFSRMSARQYALWDEKNLSQPMTREEIDNSNGVIFIFYDPDTSMVYLAGKGDSLIRFYEVTDKAPYVHFLNLYSSNTPQRGMGYMPKRGLNVNHCEIARFYKLHNNGLCEVIPFTVPRKSELFQDDLYPDTAGEQAAISADDFFQGQDADPILVSLKEGVQSSQKEKLKVVRRSNVLDKAPPNRSSSAQQAANNAASEAAPAAAALPPGFDPQAILDDMRKLKLIVKAHERRIRSLEERLMQYESEEEIEQEA
ncbi:coronin-1B-like isoform X3 [Babylonia areolata]|uniref:coronin-1B-like isoform X3 n=1 Tax=Babylonia areolata TaxID=304850 RepID=UPI003FCF4E40